MLVVWVSGLAVSERLYKGIQKGGENKIKKTKKNKKNKQTKTTKQRQTKELDRGLIKCSQGMPLKNSVEVR